MYTGTITVAPSHLPERLCRGVVLQPLQVGEPPHATQLFILIYWKQLMKWMKYYTTITYLLTYILIQGIYHGTRSAKIWIYYICQSKHTRQKSLQKYMKFWKSRLARLNDMFDSYIKENFKVVDYHVKPPSRREHNLTWSAYKTITRFVSYNKIDFLLIIVFFSSLALDI